MDKKRTRKQRRVRQPGFCWLCFWTSACIVFIFSFVIEGQLHQKESVIYNFIKNVENGDAGQAYLTENSVVLITGAAGFIGSELALALHRTYSPKRIICIDRMSDRPKGEEELARFEYQRQRVFNVMQTLGNNGVFYRTDFSPTIPEYHEVGGTYVLDHIFKENSDISHVVHLADPYPHSALQAVPREKETPKAGMMEALLEQLAKHEREGKSQSSEYNPPNFVYASSNEVYPQHKREYNTEDSVAPVLLEESQPLSTPSSLRGVSKMMDEMIAKLYYDTKGIYSVGLRFFSVYGPWGVPGSPMFEMAQRAVSGELNRLDNKFETTSSHGITVGNKMEEPTMDTWKTKKHDFVYIDDAVDAIMAAMQFRSPLRQEGTNPHPIIFNVASGKGHSLEDVLQIMNEFFPSKGKKFNSVSSSSTTESETMDSIGSTLRAKSLLGYQPQMSLQEGIVKTLAWHFDRTFPYGGFESRGNRRKHRGEELNGRGGNIDTVTQQGMAGCLPFDKECLRGTPVFPCASECAHKTQCTKSLYDEVIAITQKLTTSCETVLYTVDLDNSLTSIPSADPKLQTPTSFLKSTCNLAFVSQHSQLIRNKRANSQSIGMSGHDVELYRDGPWVLVPLNVVPIPDGEDDAEVFVNTEIMELLPKLSPGLFFQSKTTKRAIYIDPNIVIGNISKLLMESNLQPYNEKTEGATAMLIGRVTTEEKYASNNVDEEEIILKLLDPNYRPQNLESTNTRVQSAAYRMVNLAVADNQFGNEFLELLDSRWIVHGLHSDDARLFRCDILREIFQWEVTSDKSALEFIIGLHDMWSRIIAKSSGTDPWWIGDNVDTIPEGQKSSAVGRRRLQEDEDEVAVVDSSIRNSREEKEVAPKDKDDGDGSEDADDDETDNNMVGDDETGKTSKDEGPANGSGDGEEKDRGEFVADALAQKEVDAGDEERGDSSDDVREETRSVDDSKQKENGGKKTPERDFSSWMGILSTSRIKYFVRIVPSSEVGIISVDSS